MLNEPFCIKSTFKLMSVHKNFPKGLKVSIIIISIYLRDNLSFTSVLQPAEGLITTCCLLQGFTNLVLIRITVLTGGCTGG